MTTAPYITASTVATQADPVVDFLTCYSSRQRGTNPPPGQPGHDHWGGPRPRGVSRRTWQAYGDRYPGSACRWLSQAAEREAYAAQGRFFEEGA
jgi:hypothetical protein